MKSRARSTFVHRLPKLAAGTSVAPQPPVRVLGSLHSRHRSCTCANPLVIVTRPAPRSCAPAPTKPLGIPFCRWLGDFMRMNKKERNFWCVGIQGVSVKPFRKKPAPGHPGADRPRAVRNGRCVVETTERWAWCQGMTSCGQACTTI